MEVQLIIEGFTLAAGCWFAGFLVGVFWSGLRGLLQERGDGLE